MPINANEKLTAAQATAVIDTMASDISLVVQALTAVQAAELARASELALG